MLKISGEALQGGMGFGVDPQVSNLLVNYDLLLQGMSVLHSGKPFSVRLLLQVLRFVAREVAAVMVKGVQVAIVVGGGNYFRGANAWDGLERATADNIGWVVPAVLHQYLARVLRTCIPMYGNIYIYILCSTSCISAHTRRHAAVWHASAHPDEVCCLLTCTHYVLRCACIQSPTRILLHCI